MEIRGYGRSVSPLGLSTSSPFYERTLVFRPAKRIFREVYVVSQQIGTSQTPGWCSAVPHSQPDHWQSTNPYSSHARESPYRAYQLEPTLTVAGNSIRDGDILVPWEQVAVHFPTAHMYFANEPLADETKAATHDDDTSSSAHEYQIELDESDTPPPPSPSPSSDAPLIWDSQVEVQVLCDPPPPPQQLLTAGTVTRHDPSASQAPHPSDTAPESYYLSRPHARHPDRDSTCAHPDRGRPTTRRRLAPAVGVSNYTTHRAGSEPRRSFRADHADTMFVSDSEQGRDGDGEGGGAAHTRVPMPAWVHCHCHWDDGHEADDEGELSGLRTRYVGYAWD